MAANSLREATILDVAGRAGVSPATASRALSGSPHAVSAAARRRVAAAAHDLGYLRNMLARSLLTRETSAVGVLVPDAANPYYAVVLRGIEDAANRTGRAVVVCNTDRRRDKQDAYLRTLLERRVDGVIVAGGAFGRADLAAVRGRLPVVVIGRHDVPLPAVRVDNVAAARDATRHLIALGHRRIACLAGPRSSWTALDRLRGYRRACAEAGLAALDGYVVAAEFSLAGGRSGAERLAGLDEPPTAVVAGNDQVAMGLVRALHERGLRIPEDVSVVGFDDSPVASYTIPALTSVAVPMYDLGAGALALLLRVRGGDTGGPVVLPTRLHVRETTAPPAVRRAASRRPRRPAAPA